MAFHDTRCQYRLARENQSAKQKDDYVFLERERNLILPTIDLYLLLLLHRRSSSISSTALL